MRLPRPRLTAWLVLATLVWQGVAGVSALLGDFGRPRAPLSFCLGASLEARIERTLGGWYPVFVALRENVPEGAWIANRSIATPLDPDGEIAARRLVHLLYPRVLRPDVTVLEAIAGGRIETDARVFLLDLAPQEGAAMPDGERIAGGESFVLWEFRRKRE